MRMNATAICLILVGALDAIVGAGDVVEAQPAENDDWAVAVDMAPDGVSAGQIESIQACRSVEPGDEIDIDIVAGALDDITGFQIRLTFDPRIAQIEGRQADFLLRSGGFEAGDTAFPVDSGSWLYGYTNLPPRNGPGVLVRVTIKAMSKGVSALSTPAGPVDTALIDGDANYIPIQGVIQGTLRVGSDCTAEEITPVIVPPTTPGPTSPTLSGSPGPGSSPVGTPTEDGSRAGDSATSRGEATDSGGGAAPGGQGASGSGTGSSFPWEAVVGAAVAAVAIACGSAGYVWMRRRRAGR